MKFDCGCNVPEVDGIPQIDYRHLNERCPKVWELLATGKTKGVFQLENRNLGGKYAKEMMPVGIEEVSQLTALIRPGTLDVKFDDGNSATQHFIKRKNGGEEVEYIHESLRPILEQTQGIIMFQETAMAIAKEVAGFTLAESETLRKCVAKGSILYTQSGPQRIEDIVDKIGKSKTYKPKLLSTKEGKLEYITITNAWSNGKKSLLEVVTSNGYRIKVTPGHKIFTQDGWKEAQHLTTNDFAAIPDKYSYKGYCKTLNINKSILLAYFIGEGCYTGKSPQPKITNKDEEVLDLIRTCLIAEFGNKSYKEYINKHTGCTDIYLLNKAKEWIIDICATAKSRDKIIPQQILTSLKHHCQAFIGSYFSAEGSVGKINLEIASISQNIIENLQTLLLRYGIHSSIQIKCGQYKNKPYISYRLLICERTSIAKFYNQFAQYICSMKKQKIISLLSQKYQKNKYNSFRIPACFIAAVTDITNVSSILGAAEYSGSIYNSNLTYDKVSRLNKKFGSDLLQDILDNQYKFVSIRSIEKVEDDEVFDFLLDAEPHAGFVNGILVHNSMGKKKPELMAELKDKFINGCVERGGLDREIATSIFEDIEKSQRYSFNKSHAVGYGKISYQTLYAKAHFPLEFYTATLQEVKGKINGKKELVEIIRELRGSGFIVHPPSLLNMCEEFSIFNDEIYFGVTDIHGIGSSDYNRLLDKIREVEQKFNIDRKDFNHIDYITLVDANSTTMKNTISAGFLRHLGVYRKKILHDYACWKRLTAGEHKQLKSVRWNSMEDIVKYLMGTYIKKRGVRAKARYEILKSELSTLENPPTSLEDTKQDINKFEIQLLGYPITYSTLATRKITNKNGVVSCKALKMHDNGEYIVNVSIAQIKEHMVKRGKFVGKKLASIIIEDDTADIRVTAFSEVWEREQHTLFEGNTVELFVNKTDRGIFINGVKQI